MRIQVQSLWVSIEHQRGQGLVESLVAALVLTVLWVAIHWVSHYQDMALSALHASRHVAFLAARSGPAETQAPQVARSHVEGFFMGPAHRWTDRRGEAVLKLEQSLHWSVQRMQPLSGAAQPGGAAGSGATLRREWLLDDTGILSAQVALEFPAVQRVSVDDVGRLQLGQFDLPHDALRRHTAILIDAGHSESDDSTQTRVATSQLAWAAAQARSRTAGVNVSGRAEGVDSGWRRSDPNFDWLFPWSGMVPVEELEPYEGH